MVPDLSQIQKALTIRLGHNNHYNHLYATPLLVEDVFIPDLSMFVLRPMSDFLPLWCLDFSKVQSKYDIVDFIRTYQFHVRTYVASTSTTYCAAYGSGRSVGIQYSDMMGDMLPTLVFDWPGPQKVPIGQYTYAVVLVERGLRIGYKAVVRTGEIGSKHQSLVRYFEHIHPDAKIVMAGEYTVDHSQQHTINFLSGSFAPLIVLQTLGTMLNSSLPAAEREVGPPTYRLPAFATEEAITFWWNPLLQYIFPSAMLSNQPLFGKDPALDDDFAGELCSRQVHDPTYRLFEFVSKNRCESWRENPDDIRAKGIPFCGAWQTTMEVEIGRTILDILRMATTTGTKNGDVVLDNELVVTEKVLHMGDVVDEVYGFRENRPVMIKVGLTYSQRRLLLIESQLSSTLQPSPNVLLPSGTHRVNGSEPVLLLVFPYFDPKQRLSYRLQHPGQRDDMARAVANGIVPALIQLHSANVLHFGISPETIVFGVPPETIFFGVPPETFVPDRTSFLVGLSQAVSLPTHNDSKWGQIGPVAGSPTLFTSADFELQTGVSPWTDFEMLAYVLFFILVGTLPWNSTMNQIYARTYKQKFMHMLRTGLEEHLPTTGQEFLQAVMNIRTHW